jgi:hypothetical protein
MEFSEPNNFLAEVDDPRWRLDGSVTELRLKVEMTMPHGWMLSLANV